MRLVDGICANNVMHAYMRVSMNTGLPITKYTVNQASCDTIIIGTSHISKESSGGTACTEDQHRIGVITS